jgi:hypothetical protein
MKDKWWPPYITQSDDIYVLGGKCATTLTKKERSLLVPSLFKCNPPSLIAKSSLFAWFPHKNGLFDLRKFTFLLLHIFFNLECTLLIMGSVTLKSTGLGNILEIKILQSLFSLTTDIKLEYKDNISPTE